MKLWSLNSLLRKYFVLISISLIGLLGIQNIQAQSNIILIIADDLGVDFSNSYHDQGVFPTTPTIDSLRSAGLTFENVWSAPMCTPARALIMSGNYGINTGVLKAPGHLDTSDESIFKAIANQTSNQYADAVVGKWHISFPDDVDHPADHGIDYFMGVLGAGVPDYNSWDLTQNGIPTTSTNYVTTTFTDSAINWIGKQTKPYFLWLAHVTPHAPFHAPPEEMYTRNAVNNSKQKYMAMIEALDYDMKRLFDSMTLEEKENTTVIYVGDNGTPSNIIQNFSSEHAKGTVYQGGIHVPMTISGAGVTRINEREAALISVVDLYATILDIVGADLPGGIYNSLSFNHLLIGEVDETRDYNYAELGTETTGSWAIRNEQYKLVQYIDSTQKFYDLYADSLEVTNLLLGTLTTEETTAMDDLIAEADQLRTTGWSCRDHIKNGDEEDIDCGGTYCEPCVTAVNELPLTISEFKLYPNPAKQDFTIENGERQKGESYFVKVSNILGETLYTTVITVDEKKIKVKLSEIEPQIIVVTISNKNGSFTRKVQIGAQ